MFLKRKSIFFYLAITVLLCALAPSALAADAAKPVTVIDGDALTTLVEDYLEENSITPDRVAISYCYTATGEIWMYNADRLSPGASFYKLPLSMGIDRDITAGKLLPGQKFHGMRILYAMERMLVDSNNPVAEEMLSYFGDTPFSSIVMELAGLPEDICPVADITKNEYSPRLMLGILLELYRNAELYPEVINFMIQASPERFFRTTLEDRYIVAQKYGSSVPHMNCAAIVYTPQPFLLTVLTSNVSSAETVLGDLAELFADYTLSLDEEFDALSKTERRRAAGQLDTTSVIPPESSVPILTAASSEQYATQTQEFNDRAAAFFSAKATPTPFPSSNR